MKLHHALLIGALAVLLSSGRAAAQGEFEPREFVVDVNPNLRFPGLSAGERVLMFDRPVQIPGARLSAGPYIFRMVAPSLLQVADTSRQKIYATFFVIPAYRRERNDTGLDQIRFQDTGEDESVRIVAWYTPDGNGYEFPYQKPKRRSADRRSER